MNTKEHILVCVNEEAVEISQVAMQMALSASRMAQVADKALRFGVDDARPGTDLTNRKELVREFNDLIGTLELLQEVGIELPGLFERAEIDAKKARVKTWMSYAEKVGTLNEDLK